MQGGTLSRREGLGQREFCEQEEVLKSATISIWATRKSLARVAFFFFFPTVIRPFCTFAVKRYSFSASGINLYETIIDDSMLNQAEPDRCISKRKFTTADKCNRGNPNDK